MRLTIPVPISKNASHTEHAVASKGPLIAAVKKLMRKQKGAWHEVLRALAVVRRRSDAYNEYLELMEKWLQAQDTQVLEGDVVVNVTVFFPDRRIDLPNVVDVFFDAIQGWCYANDSQVVDMRFRREIDRENPRCVFTCRGLNGDLFEMAEAEEDFDYELEF